MRGRRGITLRGVHLMLLRPDLRHERRAWQLAFGVEFEGHPGEATLAVHIGLWRLVANWPRQREAGRYVDDESLGEVLIWRQQQQ